MMSAFLVSLFVGGVAGWFAVSVGRWKFFGKGAAWQAWAILAYGIVCRILGGWA